MKSKVILVVEDEALILMDIENALIEEGFEVITANNGSRANDTFDANPSRIDGVVTDINLGKGARGWDIAHHIRKHTSSMPIVYISGDSSHEWEVEGVPNSVLVPKPFVHAQLISALKTLLNQT